MRILDFFNYIEKEYKSWVFFLVKASIKIILIIVISLIIIQVAKIMIEKATSSTRRAKVNTLKTMGISCIRYIVFFIATVSILQEIGINTTSLLAGASMFGLVVGIGSQSLIRDFITGFFIILENQYDVSDYITVGEISGTVEAINLKITKLRTDEGIQYTIPNSTITKVANYSRNETTLNVTAIFSTDINVKEIENLLRTVCIKAQAENKKILEGPSVVGITAMDRESITFTITAKAKKYNQINIEAYLRSKIQTIVFESKNKLS